jgi:hypothetical protein
MKITAAFIENTRLSSYEAIFMHGGEPKDHEIFAQNDSEGLQMKRLVDFF